MQSISIPASCLLLASFQAPAAPTPSQPAASRFPASEDLQRMLDYLVADGGTPGIALGILEPDGSERVLFAGTAGADARPLGLRTVFELGSISKVFTATLLADMVARGEVALDDPVRRWLPEPVRVPARGGREITLLDLATHRSGLPRALGGDPAEGYGVEALYAFLAEHELQREIGAEYGYSNVGYGLLGLALGRAAGMDLRELIGARLLEPLGMNSTGYSREGELAVWHAQGHSGEGAVASFLDATEAIAGAGGLRANVADLLRFLRAQLGPAEGELERAMREAQRPRADAGAYEVGLAWEVERRGERALVSHSGRTAGFMTMIAFDPALETGFVLLTNTSGLRENLPLDFLGEGAPLELPVVRVPREALASYVGEYELAPGRSAFVRLEEDGTPTLHLDDGVRAALYPESPTRFFLKRARWRVAMQLDDSGRATGLTLAMGDQPPRGARKVGDEAPLPREPRDLPLDREQMERYAGTYLLRMGERELPFRVFVEEGRLLGQPGGQSPRRLLAQGRHVFVPDGSRGVRLAFAVEGGRAARLTLLQDGRELSGPRE